ncbi:inactive pancreatic lipase-related protein 1-like [Hetaerina americana]|uniref:inactive pancreatic lipase-related protein 1-like n=1 Tax=Hetaerina americana TaxID=62018 RepID=UPI003A7F24F1
MRQRNVLPSWQVISTPGRGVMAITAFAAIWSFLMMSPSSQAAISNNRIVSLVENVNRVCYGELGCLVTDEDWYDKIHRPFNPTPSAREDIRTTFKLFSQDNAQGEVLHVKPGGAIASRFFDPSKNTKIIIHGFHSDSNQDWVVNITNSLIERLHVNVITVDWSNGAGSPYFRAVSNTRVVGLELAFLINSLIGKCTDCGEDRSKCSFMGIDAEKYPGKKKPMTPKKFFLLTKSYSPFCGYHYALNLTVSPKLGGREQVIGEISATIHGDSGTVTELRFMESRSMYKGETHSFLGFTNSSAGHVNYVEFTWNWSPNSILKYLCLSCTKDLILSSLSITNMGLYSRNFLEESVACSDNATVDLKAGTPTLILLSC